MPETPPLVTPLETKEETPEDIGQMSGGEWLQHDPPGKGGIPRPGRKWASKFVATLGGTPAR